MGTVVILATTLSPSMTETAVANGDTRTINLFHAHTQESISATYLVNGRYDSAVLKQLNWFLRDWRRDEPTEMDPRLFDVVWEAYRTAGAGDEVIRVVSAYRSPETNAMLRARSRAVAKYSQHMLGKAMDTTLPGMSMSRIREIGMRMQRGGVGYYPTAGTPFVHLDVGGVRHWPRMTYDQLSRLFPDGKTVHIPSNGQMLARYDEAKAEIEARNNGAIVVEPRRSWGGNLLAMIFGGGGEDESEDAAPTPAQAPHKQWSKLASRDPADSRAASAGAEDDGGSPTLSPQLARAAANTPRGETSLSAPPSELVPSAEKQSSQDAQDEGTPRAAEEAATSDAGEPAERAFPLPPRRPAALLAAVAPLPPAKPRGLAQARGASHALDDMIVTTSSIKPKRAAERKRIGPQAALAYDSADASVADAADAEPKPEEQRTVEMKSAEPKSAEPKSAENVESARPSLGWAFERARLAPGAFAARSTALTSGASSAYDTAVGAMRSAAQAAGQGVATAYGAATGGFSTGPVAPAANKFFPSE
ncbi:DUF882 domain-containing protein [Methylocystis bryophila]|uniref:Murein endopeptidase K n=1 Tax=Methylocystis bryophila TaxID=655015 RepID=A0A1W6MTC9_9HYPH|nr:DUF882 domain-containing protein [Methylocystis bryophila]ARN80854.1 hypothetical protein B1812_06920 [Methylocystis bryophila]BDV40940.1 hypothetical protein DSM21852_41930 [Methylocystis bryophila]